MHSRGMRSVCQRSMLDRIRNPSRGMSGERAEAVAGVNAKCACHEQREVAQEISGEEKASNAN